MTKRNGFTLIELLVVIGIVAFFGALLMPSSHHNNSRARTINCISNLKQIGVGFRLFANDHEALFPAGTSQKEGGLLETVSTAGAESHFLKIAEELASPKILICPHDTRHAAETFKELRSSNVSYAVFVDSSADNPTTPLASDRNVMLGSKFQTVMQISNPKQASWTEQLHYRSGEILFGDGHVEATNNKKLQEAIDPEMQVKQWEEWSAQKGTPSTNNSQTPPYNAKPVSQSSLNRMSFP